MMTLTKPAAEYTARERREVFARLCREIRAATTPNCEGGRYSGQQIASIRGRAWKAMSEAGF